MRIWNVFKCRIVYTIEKQNRKESIMYYFSSRIKTLCASLFHFFFPNEYITFITNEVASNPWIHWHACLRLNAYQFVFQAQFNNKNKEPFSRLYRWRECNCRLEESFSSVENCEKNCDWNNVICLFGYLLLVVLYFSPFKKATTTKKKQFQSIATALSCPMTHG